MIVLIGHSNREIFCVYIRYDSWTVEGMDTDQVCIWRSWSQGSANRPNSDSVSNIKPWSLHVA